MRSSLFWVQNPALPLLTGLYGLNAFVNLAFAQTGYGQPAPTLQWEAGVSPGQPWHALAASADGIKLVGGAGTQIFISTNAGATWTLTSAPTNDWQAVASSADGSKLVAAASISFGGDNPPALFGDGLIYLSTDGGTTWTATVPAINTWSCVASSADGTKLLAAATTTGATDGSLSLSGDGRIYVSTDSGVTWQLNDAPTDNWRSVAASADGAMLVAAAGRGVSLGPPGASGPGRICVSTNWGMTWIQTTAPTNVGWVSVACSADGTRLVAADPSGGSACPCPPSAGGIYVSTDSGQSWSVTAASNQVWTAVASSADGTKLVAAFEYFCEGVPGGPWVNTEWFDCGAGIYVSTDGGVSWTDASAPSGFLSGVAWSALTCSADGYRVAAGDGGRQGLLCTLPYLGPWRIADASWRPETVASSADGTKLVAAGDFIYTSSDSGVTWTQTSATGGSVASSADGTRLIAAGDLIYQSTDSGATWKQTSAPGPFLWSSVASSADGTNLVAVCRYYPDSYNPPGAGRIYHSSDSGATWQSSGPLGYWESVASSADGTKLVASMWQDSTASAGNIFQSTDSGASWHLFGAPVTNWLSLASSADGVKLAATTDGGFVYVSTDSGATWNVSWTPTRPFYSGYDYPVSLSADGTKLVFVDSYGLIHISTNFGVTWSFFDPPAFSPGYGWLSATISADGSSIVALGDGIIGMLRAPVPPPPPSPAPRLAIAPSNTNQVLSWLIRSSSFVLQQSSDLTSTNWVDVTNQAALNFTNLHSEVTLRPPNGAAFYRLKRQ